MPQPESRPSLLGALAIIVVGLVILVPAGRCTGGIIIGTLVQAVGRHRLDGDDFMILVALAVGGPFILAGGALVVAGVRQMRARRNLSDK